MTVQAVESGLSQSWHCSGREAEMKRAVSRRVVMAPASDGVSGEGGLVRTSFAMASARRAAKVSGEVGQSG